MIPKQIKYLLGTDEARDLYVKLRFTANNEKIPVETIAILYLLKEVVRLKSELKGKINDKS